jgi:molybdate transport system substrate-binding protein
MARTRFMCALVIVDAVKQDILSRLGEDAPEIVWDPTAALMKRIEAGERADGIFAIDGSLDELEARGVISGATRRPLVQAEFGIAVQPGMQISAPADGEALKALLLRVPSIVYSRAGASGIYFEKLIDRLGIGEEIRAKSLVIPAGLTGEKVRDGQAALAVQQMSELRAVQGIDIIGPFPADVQQTTDFSAAVLSDAEDPTGAEAFIAALTTPAAREAYLARGLKVRF